MPQVIASRIQHALDAGGLIPVQTQEYRVIHVMNDLMDDWDVLFPGASKLEDIQRPRLFTANFIPQRRRSPYPLPLPRIMKPRPKTFSRDIHSGVQAVWAYYQEEGKAAADLLTTEFSSDGLTAFLKPLYEDLSAITNADTLTMYWEDYDIDEVESITCELPVISYDEEHAGVMEAFLSGTEAIASLMTSCGEERPFDLTDEDSALVKEIGWVKLIETYHAYEGEKAVDTKSLFAYDTFFNVLEEEYPEHMQNEMPIIAGTHGQNTACTFTSLKDIRFFFSWCNRYHELLAKMPDPYWFYCDESGERDSFAANVCAVYRLATEGT